MAAEANSSHDERMLKFESGKSVEEVVAAIREVSPAHKFSVLHAHSISGIFKKKGIEGYKRECSVVEVCHGPSAKRILETDTRLTSMLPCRIAVFSDEREDGTAFTRVETVRPTLLLGFFPGVPESAGEVASEVEATMLAIMEASL